MSEKRILLIAGAGTLGGYATLELLANGWTVDVICLNSFRSYSRRLRYFNERVTDELLNRLFAENHYDCIIDFIHYSDWKNYPSRGKLLLANTDQLIFLSSYRVYADLEHPIRETSPQLLDALLDDELFQTKETYANPKSHNERFLRAYAAETGRKNWTIIRPVISFSHYRLDLICTGAGQLLRSAEGKKILLPEESKNIHAGLSWAYDSGRLIARLAGNEKALGEAFTIGAGENLLWSEVTDFYSDIMGCEFIWIPADDYEKVTRCDHFGLRYDRVYDRAIDNSKLFAATGFTMSDMRGVRAGIIHELDEFARHPEYPAAFDTPSYRSVNDSIDAYITAM